MKNINLLILALLLIKTVQLHGQSESVEEKLKAYIRGITTKNIKAYLVLEQGCIGCEVSYQNKVVADAKTYYIISENNKLSTLQKIDSFQEYPAITLDTTSVFKMIEEKKKVFEEMDTYLKTMAESEKGLKFVPPSPVHYTYTSLEVNLPDFKKAIEIVNKEYDCKGYLISNKERFEPIRQLIEYISHVVAEEK